jgi:hypothetical protein
MQRFNEGTQMAKIHRFETTTAPLSPARSRLKALLDQRAAAEQRIASLRSAESRLMDTLDEAVRATKALIDFDAESKAATLAWAKNALSKEAAPQVDTDRRQELLAAKAIASENGAAANGARSQIQADIHAEARASQALQPEIEQAIAEIIAETAESLIEDLRESVRVAVAKQNRLKQALQAVIGIAHSAGPLETMKPTFKLMEELAERLRTATAPAVETTGADRAAWECFAGRLRNDAAADLKI